MLWGDFYKERYVMSEELSVTMRGICSLWFEAGTEGVYWAFQDKRFVGIPDSMRFCCVKCGRVWDKKRNECSPKRIFDDECDHIKDHEWKLLYPNGLWLREGLHILSEGDLLSVFNKNEPKKILWKERILFDPSHTGGAHLRIGACCTRSGVLKKKWFTENYPAELTLGKESLLHWGERRKKDVEAKLKELGRS
jgi:hypothetical protein